MLTISENALAVIQRATAHPQLAATSGLRIASDGEAGAPLKVRPERAPHVGDRVVDREGARLFLDTEAAERIASRELDAVTEPDGTIRMVLRAPRGRDDAS